MHSEHVRLFPYLFSIFRLTTGYQSHSWLLSTYPPLTTILLFSYILHLDINRDNGIQGTQVRCTALAK